MNPASSLRGAAAAPESLGEKVKTAYLKTVQTREPVKEVQDANSWQMRRQSLVNFFSECEKGCWESAGGTARAATP